MEYITIEAARRGEVVVSCKGKTRTVFIVSDLRKKLVSYAKKHGIDSGMIFVTKNGKAIDRSNIWREMKNLCKQAFVDRRKLLNF